MSLHKGCLVSIEGPDGAGKKTQSSKVTLGLNQAGIRARMMSFPDYSTPIGKEIRAFLDGERTYGPEVRHILFAANRWEKKQEICNMLDQLDVLIINRYTESNLVYGRAYGLNINWLKNLEAGMPKSDLVIVLDVDPEIALQRKTQQIDKYEADIEIQYKIREIYSYLARKNKWKVVDANKSIDDVYNEVFNIISSHLAKVARG